MNTKKDMEFKSEEDFRGVAKRAVQILLYVVESKSPLLRKLRAKNFISNIYGANQNGTVYFEVEVPFTVTDPDHGPLCQELDKVLSAVIKGKLISVCSAEDNSILAFSAASFNL